MTDAIAGVGASLKRSDMASSPAFTAIAEVKNITGPGMSRDFIDASSLDSTGGYREFISGFRDGGELTFSMNFVFDGYNDTKTDFESSTAVDYQIVLPDTGSTTLDFSGYVTALPLNITPDDAVTCDVTIKITGQVDLSS